MVENRMSKFLINALENPATCWELGGIAQIGALQVPDSILGQAPDILQGDINHQWAKWFINSSCDIEDFVEKEKQYPSILSDVVAWVRKTFPHFQESRTRNLATCIARLINEETIRRRKITKRPMLSSETRQQLVDLANGEPRCWICGFKFSAEAVSNFLNKKNAPLPLPPLIDIYKPIGLFCRDVSIEVDHVVPYSKGGGSGDNLRLCCGWCNRHKASHSSIYETSGEPRRGLLKQKKISLPQPFWIVKMLALSNRRELPDGKDYFTPRTELTIAPRNPSGLMTPPNMKVVSYQDDPIVKDRFDTPKNVTRLWKG